MNPEEQQDNTRVSTTPIFLKGKPRMVLPNDQLWDADKVKQFQNIQDFYNTNAFGYGISGNQTTIDPRTKEGQVAILSNLDYSKKNVQNLAENILFGMAGEVVGQAAKYAATPRVIGGGAEVAEVTSAPLSMTVTKTGSLVPRAEMHARNKIPAAVKSYFIGSSNGLNNYMQGKVRLIPKEQLSKAYSQLERIMARNGWTKITHPNLEGPGFTNGRMVVSDLGYGNVGRDLLGRPRLIDFALETVPEFRAAVYRKGGNINKI